MDNCCELIPAEYSFQHQHFLGKASFSYTAEKSCYINILLSDESEAITYLIANKSFLLYKGSNVLHYLDKGIGVSIKSLNDDNDSVIILTSPQSLHFFHTKYHPTLRSFGNGFATKNDARRRLLFEQ